MGWGGGVGRVHPCTINIFSEIDRYVEERACCFAFLWFVACVLSVLVCLLFLLVSLVGYVL